MIWIISHVCLVFELWCQRVDVIFCECLLVSPLFPQYGCAFIFYMDADIAIIVSSEFGFQGSVVEVSEHP